MSNGEHIAQSYFVIDYLYREHSSSWDVQSLY